MSLYHLIKPAYWHDGYSVRQWPGRPEFNPRFTHTQKMVLDASLLNTKHYKVRMKSKVEQSKERSCAFPYTLVL